MSATARARVGTVQRADEERPPRQLLQFDFEREDLSVRTRQRGAKAGSIKEALVRWLEEQL